MLTLRQRELPAVRVAGPAEGQTPLFGKPEPRARRILDRAPRTAAGDPISSYLAVAELTRCERWAAQKSEALTWLRAQGRPFTSMEIADAVGPDRYMCARHLPDLEKDGLVERCPVRECFASRRSAITWRATI